MEQLALDCYPDSWHTISLELPIPTHDQARIVVESILTDKPVKSPHLVRRSITIKPKPSQPSSECPNRDPALILISIAALTVRQARVSFDHLLSDIDLVLEAIHEFSPDRISCLE